MVSCIPLILYMIGVYGRLRYVVERRDGCVYRTELLSYIWIPLDEVTSMLGESFNTYYQRKSEYESRVAKENGGDMLCSVPSSFPYEETYKTVKE